MICLTSQVPTKWDEVICLTSQVPTQWDEAMCLTSQVPTKWDQAICLTSQVPPHSYYCADHSHSAQPAVFTLYKVVSYFHKILKSTKHFTMKMDSGALQVPINH